MNVSRSTTTVSQLVELVDQFNSFVNRYSVTEDLCKTHCHWPVHFFLVFASLIARRFRHSLCLCFAINNHHKSSSIIHHLIECNHQFLQTFSSKIFQLRSISDENKTNSENLLNLKMNFLSRNWNPMALMFLVMSEITFFFSIIYFWNLNICWFFSASLRTRNFHQTIFVIFLFHSIRIRLC